MQKLLNWSSWISATVLVIVLALAQMAFSKQQDRLSFFRVVLAILIAIASQVGLFVSPWVVDWRNSFQKLVFAAMLPSTIWLIGQLRTDLKDVLGGVEEDHILEYGVEVSVLLLILVIYVIQLVRVSLRFLKQPSVKADG